MGRAPPFVINVTNTGTVDADDVVLGFISPPGAGTDGLPLKELFGFERVHVKAGQTTTVWLYPAMTAFSQTSRNGERTPLSGEYRVSFGVGESARLGMGFAETSIAARPSGTSIAAQRSSPNAKSVLLWTTEDDSTPASRAALMAKLQRVRDVVDVVSPCTYYIEQTLPHGLRHKEGANETHAAIKKLGFKVQPLVGDISGGWNISWYRATLASTAFADAAVAEIKGGGLDGLNFDYEPHQPGDLRHHGQVGGVSAGMMAQIALRSGSEVSVDFPCDGQLCDAPTLATSQGVGRIVDMSTYGGAETVEWNRTMHTHIAQVGGVSRYGLGVCPLCSPKLTSDQITTRLALAEAAGVQEIAFWANVDESAADTLWWAAIRKWKVAK